MGFYRSHRDLPIPISPFTSLSSYPICVEIRRKSDVVSCVQLLNFLIYAIYVFFIVHIVLGRIRPIVSQPGHLWGVKKRTYSESVFTSWTRRIIHYKFGEVIHFFRLYNRVHNRLQYRRTLLSEPHLDL